MTSERPVFFSVASQNIGYAETVWGSLPPDLVYLYSKSGVEGEHLWREISEKNLPQCKFFVVFWSRQYVDASGCIREIQQAHKLKRQGLLTPIVLRLDDFPIKWRDDIDTKYKPVFDDLDALLDYRTSKENQPVHDATELIHRRIEPLLQSNHPKLIRNETSEGLRLAITRTDKRFTCYPAVWVSGFNGVGRQTLIEDLNRSFTPNGRPISADIDETTLPQQIVLRLNAEAYAPDFAGFAAIRDDPTSETIAAVVAIIERIFNSGNYVIFRHHRVVEEGVELPEWIDAVISELRPGNRSKLFIVSQQPLSLDRRRNCGEMLSDFRVPTLDNETAEDYARQLFAYFDSTPERWDNSLGEIVRSAGGTLGFLVPIVRTVCKMSDTGAALDIINSRSTRMSESITAYVRWAFKRLGSDADAQKILIVLNNVSPMAYEDLRQFIGVRELHAALGKLLGLGLVEREDGGLYRITPLLSRRLERDLVRSEFLDWYGDTTKAFAASPIEFQMDGNDYVRIESRITASYWANEPNLAAGLNKFASAAHWFQAGIRLYHVQHREPAYKLLKMAYSKRDSFSDLSKFELIRYFGLSAVRNGKSAEVEECISLLSRDARTKGIAKFIEAFSKDEAREYLSAIPLYEEALALNVGNERRKERTFRPLIKCILSTANPDFQKAELIARTWIGMTDTVFAKMGLARVRLHWKYRGQGLGRTPPPEIDDLLNRAMKALKDDPGVGSGHFELQSEEANLRGDKKRAVELMDLAIKADPRFELRLERWQLMAKSATPELAKCAVEELEGGKSNPTFKSNWRPFLGSLTDCYVRALSCLGSIDQQKVQRFAQSLPSHEIGSIISRAKRSSA